MSAVCSKKMQRGHCKRVVVFYAEFHGRRENACVAHLGEILVDQGLSKTTRASVFLRSEATS